MIWYLSPLSLITCNSLYFELGKTRYAILKIKWNSFQNLFLHFSYEFIGTLDMLLKVAFLGDELQTFSQFFIDHLILLIVSFAMLKKNIFLVRFTSLL